MQNYCKTIGALAAASALVAGNATAEVEYELHTGYTSEYLFRGLNLGQDLVEVGVDVAGEWNGIGLSAGAWYASYDRSFSGLRNPDGTPVVPNGHAALGEFDVDELDLYAEISKDFGFLTAAVGYIYYYNEDSLDYLGDAQEVYFSVGRDFGFANATFTYFWDVQTDNDGYSELTLDRSFELNSCLDLAITTGVGYLFEEGDFTAWTTKVALDWEFVENARLSPFVALSIALSETSKTTGGPWADTQNELVAGSMLSVSF